MKIYISDTPDPLMGQIRCNDLPFHFERHKWTFVNKLSEADVIPILVAPLEGKGFSFTLQDQLDLIRPYKDKLFLLMVHNHIAESMGQQIVNLYLNNYSEFKNIFVVSVNLIKAERQISYNYYFNWVKAHFSQYNSHDLKHERLWVEQCNKQSFELPNIKLENPTKKFCIPNVVRNIDTHTAVEFKNYARIILSKNIDPEDSYYSDFKKNVVLFPEESGLYPGAYEGIETGTVGVGIIPIANKYFTDSIVSVFVESVTRKFHNNAVLAFTEKTYIPLVKGHFILPFGSPGIIQELKNQGFLFPNWIDYSYDIIDNDEDRLAAFLKSFKKLKDMQHHKLVDLANQDLALRKNNRNVIVRYNFDSLYDKVERIFTNKDC
jgi:hypothetical protein